MAKSKELQELTERFDSMAQMMESMIHKQSQPVEKPKSVLAKHFDNIVENAITNPASTISGVGVGVAYVGKMLFPEHAETFQNIEVLCITMTGVSAGSTSIKGATAVKNTKTPTPPKSEEYG